MKKHSVTLRLKEKLHMRPMADIVKITSAFSSNITISSGELSADAKSILSLLEFAAAMAPLERHEVSFLADGDDAKKAIESITTLSCSLREFEGKAEDVSKK
jgi:phosphotransferase system HPr (HPr) family protein